MAAESLLSSLKTAGLLPSPLIPSSFDPAFSLAVKFPTTSPQNGALVRKSEVQDQPSVAISPSSSCSAAKRTYTLALLDPDAPTPAEPKFAFWRHWLITGLQTIEGSIDTEFGKTLTRWLAPRPKDDSGPHRYLFLLFAEPEAFELSEKDVGGEEFVERRSFPAVDFMEKWGLELVGVQWMRGMGDGWQEAA